MNEHAYTSCKCRDHCMVPSVEFALKEVSANDVGSSNLLEAHCYF